MENIPSLNQGLMYMSPRKVVSPVVVHKCRECAKVEIVTKFSTLSLKGEPTLGRCPHEKYCVILNHKACDNFVMKRT